MLVLFSRAAFIRQRKLGVERVLLEVARGSSGKGLSREATASARRIWDRAVLSIRGAHQVGNATREPVDPDPKVFLNEVAHVIGRLLRWDDKSRSSALSAILWAARDGDSGAE